MKRLALPVVGLFFVAIALSFTASVATAESSPFGDIVDFEAHANTVDAAYQIVQGEIVKCANGNRWKKISESSDEGPTWGWYKCTVLISRPDF